MVFHLSVDPGRTVSQNESDCQVSAGASVSKTGQGSAVLTAPFGQRLQVLACQSVVLSQDVAFSL